MAGLDDVICTHCRKSFRAASNKTFLGFRKYICISCSQKVIYPLGPITRVIYWVVAALFVVLAALTLAQGSVPVPGVLLVGATWGLVKDFSIRKKVREIESTKWA